MRWGLGWGWVTPYQKVMFHVSVQFSNFSKWLYQKGKKGKSLGCVEAVSTVMVMWLLIKPFHPPRTSTVACEGAVHPPHCAATSKESNRQARADLWLDTICRPSSASICSTSSSNIMLQCSDLWPLSVTAYQQTPAQVSLQEMLKLMTRAPRLSPKYLTSYCQHLRILPKVAYLC